MNGKTNCNFMKFIKTSYTFIKTNSDIESSSHKQITFMNDLFQNTPFQMVITKHIITVYMPYDEIGASFQ